MIALLPCRVPYLEANFSSIVHCHAFCRICGCDTLRVQRGQQRASVNQAASPALARHRKLTPNGAVDVVGELVLHEPKNDAGLPDSTFTQQYLR